VRELRTETGQLRPDAFVILAEALNQVDEAERRRILTAIFGQRASLGIIRLVEQERRGYERARRAAQEHGTALQQGQARARGFAGATDELKDNSADFARELGELTQGPATDFVNFLSDGFRAGEGLASLTGDLADGIGDIADEIRNLNEQASSQFPGGGFLSDAAGFVFGTNTFEIINGLVAEIRGGEPAVRSGFSFLGEAVGAGMRQLEAEIRNGRERVEDEARKVGAGIGGALSVDVAVASVSGNQSGQLAALRQLEARQLANFNRQVENFNRGGTKEQAAAVDRARAQLESTRSEIQSILREQEAAEETAAAESERLASELIDAANRRDQAFLRGLTTRETDLRGRISAASETETLRDDIRFNVRLRNFLRRAIEQTRERIREARAAGRETEALIAFLGDLRRARNQVRREIEALSEQRAENAAATRVENARLDLQILETRVGGDPNASQTARLIAAHQRVIASLKRQQQLAKGRKLEIKRLQLEIEQEKAAIRDLRNASSSSGTEGGSFAQLSFSFLQEQQGILSNFGPNFFPPGALTVGGSASTAAASRGTRPRALRPDLPDPLGGARNESNAKAAVASTGITNGQANELIFLQRQIVHELRQLRRGAGHPRNRHAERWAGGSHDHQMQ
jgi:hypothetical protein